MTPAAGARAGRPGGGTAQVSLSRFCCTPVSCSVTEATPAPHGSRSYAACGRACAPPAGAAAQREAHHPPTVAVEDDCLESGARDHGAAGAAALLCAPPAGRLARDRHRRGPGTRPGAATPACERTGGADVHRCQPRGGGRKWLPTGALPATHRRTAQHAATLTRRRRSMPWPWLCWCRNGSDVSN